MRLMVVASLLVASLASADCPRETDATRAADAYLATNLDQAISHYEQARTDDPKNTTLLWKLARAYEKKESWEKASDVLRTLCELAPTFPTHFHERGVALVHLAERTGDDIAEARASFERAIALDSNYAAPHRELALLLAKVHDDAGALAHLTTAITLRPNDVASYVALSNLYLRLRCSDQALAVAREGLTWGGRDDQRFALLMTSAAALGDKGDGATALAVLEQAKIACGHCNERGQQRIYFELGAAYARAKRTTEAMASLLSFQKIICKGGAAALYAYECTVAMELMRNP